MEVGKLNVALRTGTGKSVTRKLRQQGQIPAVCYGPKADPILVALDPTALMKSLDPEKRTNTVIALTIAGGGKSETVNVMLRDWQRDAVRGDLTHADFLRVDLTKEVRATVPIILIGKAEGVKLGGIMHQVVRVLEVACTPDKIPTKIEVNVEALNMGEALHVSDLTLGAGVRPLVSGGLTICSVTAPKAEKTAAEVAAEAAAAEGVVPAEGEAAAAPAEGAKPGAAPAAPEKKGAEKAAPEKKK